MTISSRCLELGMSGPTGTRRLAEGPTFARPKSWKIVVLLPAIITMHRNFGEPLLMLSMAHLSACAV